MVKRIGVMTSGGDCAGLNACIRAVTHHATKRYDVEVVGIKYGTTGLIHRPMEHVILTPENCDTLMMRTGGTILGSTNKDNPYHFPNEDGSKSDRSKDFCEGYYALGLDGIIGIGGDGSMKILRNLAKQGNLNLITVPKTIDNDLGGTESAIGYASALDAAMEALDFLQPTAASHKRAMVLEVMGRDAGHIALGAGVAGGADVILIPEIPHSLDKIYAHLNKIYESGRKHALIITAEAVKKDDGEVASLSMQGHRPQYGGIGQYLAEKITENTKFESRATVLGHVQRGVRPNAFDRIAASAFGMHAVDLMMNGKTDRMVAWSGRNVIDIPITDAIETYQSVNTDDVLIRVAKSMGTYIGDLAS